MQTTTFTKADIGCFLDNRRGHYIVPAMIELAVEHGFIVGPFEKYALSMYDTEPHGHAENAEYPHEGLIELSNDALAWLNSGTGKCEECDGDGEVITSSAQFVRLSNSTVVRREIAGKVICKTCSGTGRGNRIAGQNFPPIIPNGCHWDWNDGDFGLYWIQTEGECPICGADGNGHLTGDEIANIEATTGEPWWVRNCSH